MTKKIFSRFWAFFLLPCLELSLNLWENTKNLHLSSIPDHNNTASLKSHFSGLRQIRVWHEMLPFASHYQPPTSISTTGMAFPNSDWQRRGQFLKCIDLYLNRKLLKDFLSFCYDHTTLKLWRHTSVGQNTLKSLLSNHCHF